MTVSFQILTYSPFIIILSFHLTLYNLCSHYTTQEASNQNISCSHHVVILQFP